MGEDALPQTHVYGMALCSFDDLICFASNVIYQRLAPRGGAPRTPPRLVGTATLCPYVYVVS